MAEEETCKMVKITVKTPKEKQDIEIDMNAHVKEVIANSWRSPTCTFIAKIAYAGSDVKCVF